MTTDLFILQYEELITTNSPITRIWLRSMKGVNQAITNHIQVITNHIQAIRNHEQELQQKEQRLDEVKYKLQKLVWEKEYLSNNI